MGVRRLVTLGEVWWALFFVSNKVLTFHRAISGSFYRLQSSTNAQRGSSCPIFSENTVKNTESTGCEG